MKIGIITFHRADNYGAVLQAYALQKVFENINHEVNIIDYRCSDIEKEYGALKFPKLCKNVTLWLKRIPQWYYSKSLIDEKTERFNKFRMEYMNLTDALFSEEDHRKIEEEYDLIVTGSDQVWNPSITGGVDSWYYFIKTLENNEILVASYAASVGNINEYKSWFPETKKYLECYNFISVREIDAYNYLKKIIPHKNITLCIDPTLLVDSELWRQISNNKVEVSEPYLLYYDAAQNDEAKKIAIMVAKSLNLRLVHFNPDLYKLNNSSYVVNAGPIEFLSYIRNASFVVTSSFHGTVFSLIFERKFISVAHPRHGGRVKDLLSIVQLENRICLKADDANDKCFDEIDYLNVKKIINDYRASSLEYINMITLEKI